MSLTAIVFLFLFCSPAPFFFAKLLLFFSLYTKLNRCNIPAALCICGVAPKLFFNFQFFARLSLNEWLTYTLLFKIAFAFFELMAA